MKKFNFRLKKILDINEHKKQEAIKIMQYNLGQQKLCEEALNIIVNQCDKLILEIKSITGGSFCLARLTMLKDYLLILRKQQREKEIELKKIINDVEIARQNLIIVNRENRTLEKLESYDLEQYQQESLRNEQIEIDEIAGVGYYRKNIN